MIELQTLRAQVADLKAAPVYLKASRAEKTIDAAVVCLDAQAAVMRSFVLKLVEFEVSLYQLEERKAESESK